MAEIPRWYHQLQGIDPITEVQPPLKCYEIGVKEFEGPKLWFENTGFIEVEV
jgi:hypothetical protein